MIRINKTLLTIFSIYMLTINVSATIPPSEEWNKTYGFGQYITTEGSDVVQTNDGGYIISGLSPYSNAWIVKTDHNGIEEWNKTFISSYSAGRIRQTSGGDFIFVTNEYDAPWTHPVLIKIYQNGELSWRKDIGGTGYSEYAYSVLETADFGYIIAIERQSNNFWIMKTDANGQEEWNKTFLNTGGYTPYDLTKTNDGGYAIVGTGNNPSGKGDHDGFIIKTNSTGDEEWRKYFGKSLIYDFYKAEDGLQSIDQTNDNGYILVGYTPQKLAAGGGWYYSDLWIIKIDSNGEEMWNQTFGGILEDYGYSIEQTIDKDYIIAGYTKSYGQYPGHYFGWIIKTDSSGNELYNRTFGESDYNIFKSVKQTRDQGYIITGITRIFIDNDWRNRAWLVKLSIPNQPPIAEAGGPYIINEGDTLTLDGSASSDPDRDQITYAWDLNNDSIYETPGMIVTMTPQDGPANITIGLQVSDGKGGIDTDTATITVNNVPPEVGPITFSPPDPIVDNEIIATSPISDKGTLDTHTATWNWGDGTTSTGTISSGIASGNHIYTTNGTFHVTLTVTDNDGGSTTSGQDIEVKKPCKCEKITIIPKTSTQGKTITLDAIVTGSKNQSTSPVSWDAIIDINWDITIKCTEGDGECSADLEPTKPTSTWDVAGKGGTVLSQSHTAADGSATITCKALCGKEQKTTVMTTYKATIQKGTGSQGDITGTVTGNIELGMKSKNPDCPGEWKMKLKYIADTKKDTIKIDPAGSDYDGDGKPNNVDKYPLDPSKYK